METSDYAAENCLRKKSLGATQTPTSCSATGIYRRKKAGTKELAERTKGKNWQERNQESSLKANI